MMTENSELLSLAEVEALSRDSLMRAGASQSAADAAAWSIRICERNGKRSDGLERLPRLLEGLRMGAINGTATPVLSRSLSTVLRIEAGCGLADAAIAVALETVSEVTRSFGMALLTVSESGDSTVPDPWIERLAENGVTGLFLGGNAGSGFAVPGSAGQVRFASMALDDQAAGQLVEALAGAPSGADLAPDAPFSRPIFGTACFVALQPPRNVSIVAGTGEFSSGEKATFDMGQRRKADTEGVKVPSDLLVHIMTA